MRNGTNTRTDPFIIIITAVFTKLYYRMATMIYYRMGYSHLKEEALDRTMWRARFGRGFEPVIRQTTKWMKLSYGSFTDTVRHSMPISVVKVKVKLPLRIPWGHIHGGEVQLHSFITSTFLMGSEESAACPYHLSLGKQPLYPLSRSLSGPKSQTGYLENRKISFPKWHVQQ